jgi:hypothetical protein
MELTLLHGIQYDVTEPVAVEDLIKSLAANARLMREAATLLAALVPGIEFDVTRISVPELGQGSPLREVMALAVVLTFQKDLESEVPKLFEHLTGVHVSDSYDGLLTVLVMLIAIYGISKVFELLFPGKGKAEAEDTEDALLDKASSILGIGAETIRVKLGELLIGRRRRGILLASQQVFAPTRGQHAAIRERGGEILVPAKTVALAQAAAGLPLDSIDEDDKPKTSSEFHRNVRIILHAMDSDSKKRGWAGHIPDLIDERIPMHLEKSVSPAAIFGKRDLQGDILLTREEDENGDMQPKEFLLIQAYAQ